MSVDVSKSLGELVEEMPGASRVMERFGLDYCCGGKRSLEVACAARELDLAAVVGALEQAIAGPVEEAPVDWSARSLTELVDYINSKHHTFTRDSLQMLGALAEKVYAVHGATHPELAAVKRLYFDLDADLQPHLLKEEQILFPYIRSLEGGASSACFGSVASPIAVMLSEHDAVGDLLARLREVTRGYALPAEACRSYRALYEGLEDLEKDLHQHIHLENNVLFPRSLEAEQRLSVA